MKTSILFSSNEMLLKGVEREQNRRKEYRYSRYGSSKNCHQKQLRMQIGSVGPKHEKLETVKDAWKWILRPVKHSVLFCGSRSHLTSQHRQLVQMMFSDQYWIGILGYLYVLFFKSKLMRPDFIVRMRPNLDQEVGGTGGEGTSFTSLICMHCDKPPSTWYDYKTLVTIHFALIWLRVNPLLLHFMRLGWERGTVFEGELFKEEIGMHFRLLFHITAHW